MIKPMIKYLRLICQTRYPHGGSGLFEVSNLAASLNILKQQVAVESGAQHAMG